MGAAFGTSAPNAPVMKATSTPTVFIVDDPSLTDRNGAWHSTPDASPDGLLLSADNNDVDDELVLPMPMAVRLRPLRVDVPIGAIHPLPVTPAAPLPRPPDLA